MANTYTLISSSTLASTGTSDFIFSSIPNTYTDLLIKISARLTGATTQDSMYVRFNGSSGGTDYQEINLRGNGTTAAGNFPGTNQEYVVVGNALPGSSSLAQTFSNTSLYIPNYSSSTKKSLSVEAVNANNTTTAYLYLVSGLWNLTNAITSIKFTSASAYSFAQHSSFYLYGIKNS
jgi:hypothetical protein